jgi:hypothetical protein
MDVKSKSLRVLTPADIARRANREDEKRQRSDAQPLWILT